MLFLPWVASTQAVRNDLSRSLLTCILILYRVIWYLSYIDILVYTWWIAILYIFMLNKFCLSPESWVLSWNIFIHAAVFLRYCMTSQGPKLQRSLKPNWTDEKTPGFAISKQMSLPPFIFLEAINRCRLLGWFRCLPPFLRLTKQAGTPGFHPSRSWRVAFH